MSDEDFERRLRASLRRHAQRAPDGDRLAERVAREVRGEPVALRRRQPRAWLLPLAAAAAVAVLAGAVVAISQVGGSPHPTAATEGPTSVFSGSPLDVPTTPIPTTGPAPTSTTAPAVPPELTDVHVIDASFTGARHGWLLARAACTDGSPGPCTAMLRTTDGGAHWTSMPNPPVNVPGVNGCASPCVDHIRFATSRTGYAYGDGFDSTGAFSGALFMTTDGGQTWQRQQGSAHALETLDGNVIRVTETHPECGGFGCDYVIETAAIGSTRWQQRPIGPYFDTSVGAVLARGGSDAYLLVLPHSSGNGPASLYRSSDDGRTWTNSGGGKTYAQLSAHAPCPQSGGETVGSAIAAGADGRVSLICTVRDTGRSFLAVSTDHGAHFTAEPGAIPHRTDDLLAGDPATVLLVASTSRSGEVYRSTDGGTSWQAVPGISGAVSWLGFESASLGRIVTDGGRTLWTTRDAGASWTPITFN